MWQFERAVHGPDEARRAATETIVWGEVSDASGRRAVRRLRTPNGYDITVTAALGLVERLRQAAPTGGYYTPSLLAGPDYVLDLPGVMPV